MVAAEYADRGWPVFPLAPRTKIPLKDSRGLYDATCESNRLRAWWSSTPEANIGLRTGLAFDVLDVDAHHGGLDTLADIVGADDVLVACGPCVRTPNGGAHLYYLPTGFGNRAGIAPGIDWRGDGGYVVAPPSVTREGDYTWHVQNGEAFNYDRPLVPVPKWLCDLVGRADAPNVPSVGPHNRPPTSKGTNGYTPHAYLHAALQREELAVAWAPRGCRNDQLNRSAHSLARLEGLDDHSITEVLAHAAAAAGLPEREARRTILSALRARRQ
jgi:hypothetical protein